MRKLRFALATLIFLGLVWPVAATAATPATVAVFTVGSTTYTAGGRTQSMDVAPFIAAGRTYVPVRFLAGALGVASEDIGWDGATRTVTLNLEENGGRGRDIVLGLTIGSKTMSVTNRPGDRGIQAQFISLQKVRMDTAPVIVDGRTMVPARWVAQAFGYSVRWNQERRTVTVQRPLAA